LALASSRDLAWTPERSMGPWAMAGPDSGAELRQLR
jgi:hypothetical protein